jgi:opacity protein-like surface antigen
LPRHLSQFAVVAVLVFSGVQVASAQEVAARHSLTALAGPVNFDLSGTGTTAGFALRGTRALTSHLALEMGFLFARPKLQDGDRATLFAPEAHLQYHWRTGRMAPYAGGGIGLGRQSRDFVSVTEFTLSAVGGARFYVTERVAAVGEFRLRGFERQFTGSTAEWMGGLSFAIGR